MQAWVWRFVWAGWDCAWWLRLDLLNILPFKGAEAVHVHPASWPALLARVQEFWCHRDCSGLQQYQAALIHQCQHWNDGQGAEDGQEELGLAKAGGIPEGIRRGRPHLALLGQDERCGLL